jgi:hypothetical protein
MAIYTTPSYHDEFIGPEDENTEYKEFTFNSAGPILDTKLAESYCQNSNFDFNESVISNLKKYFKVYMPKYFTAFKNASMEGDLYIGVNDFGFVKGIPYKGNLPIEYLEGKIFKSLEEYIQDSNTFNFNDLIEINFIKLSLPNIPDTLINPKFFDYLCKKQEYLIEYKKWVERFENWKIRYMFFTQKLVDLVNNKESREMLIQWIKTQDPNNQCIALLETNFQLEHKDHGEIAVLKEDPTNVYYWVCMWKDHITDYLKTIKPVFSHDFNQHNLPINLIVSANEMIPYWTNYNSDMNLYLIRIKFKNIINSNAENKVMINYREPSKKQWLCCYRTTNIDGTPFCKPL